MFNFCFVDEIKHLNISQAYKKSRLVIQTYNDHEKTLMLTQAFIIQRMSQRIILVIAASINENHHLYLRNIIQIYTQSKSFLNRMFFSRSFLDLNLSNDAILKVIKSLYNVSKAKAHWFNISWSSQKESQYDEINVRFLFVFHQSEWSKHFQIDKDADKQYVNVEKWSFCWIRRKRAEKSKTNVQKARNADHLHSH